MLPHITCVCVSQNRPAFLKKAIDYFNAQTYQNKSLVIVYEGDGALWQDSTLLNDKIKVIKVPLLSGISLGERRNLSVEHCSGDYFCQWDDDDWFHVRRLELQMEALIASKKPACVLSRLILYDAISRQAYLSSERYWEGTLLCRTGLFNDTLRYPNMNKSEDNSLVVNLVKKDCVQTLSLPFLYSYFFHGKNTWDATHFHQLFQAGYKLDERAHHLMEKIFQGKYDCGDASEKIQQLNLEVFR